MLWNFFLNVINLSYQLVVPPVSSLHACLCMLSHVWLFVAPSTIARQAFLGNGISQARILEWVAMPSSRGSSWPKDWTHISCISCIGRQILYHWATREAPSLPQITDFLVGEDCLQYSASASALTGLCETYHCPLAQIANIVLQVHFHDVFWEAVCCQVENMVLETL